MWVISGICSAFFLGIYDVCKKIAVKENAVIPVLFFSTLSAAILFVPILFTCHFYPLLLKDSMIFIPQVSTHTHLMIFLKAIIVNTSWIFSFFAMKHLPITIVTPIRATGPLWTLIGAIIIFSEHLNLLQWSGIATTLLFFYLFSLAGLKEGISFQKNKWIWFIILGTLTGAASGLYDKFLIGSFNRMAVQSWFSISQFIIMAVILLFLWYPKRHHTTPFKWSWAIPLIGIFLVIADFLYFFALSHTDSLISILSAVRRGGVVVSFAMGAILFKEKNISLKGWLLLGILAGIALIMYGSH